MLDRLIQQALAQVLQAEWDRSFSRFSFGFRPQRSAHQAIACAQQSFGKATPGWWTWMWSDSLTAWVHEVLMSRVKRRIADPPVLIADRPIPEEWSDDRNDVGANRGGSRRKGVRYPLCWQICCWMT